MHFDADMMGDEPDDALGVGGRDAAAGVFQSPRQPVDPEPAVGVEHHLDNGGVFEVASDRRSERGAQHARAAGEGLGLEGSCRHYEPRKRASSRRMDQRGRLERAGSGQAQQA